jgi:hypothetical protein
MNWKIEFLKTTPTTATPPEFVIECGWRCMSVDGTFSGTVYGTCSFTQAANSDGTYTPYDKLTEAQVLGWVWSSGVDKAEVEANVAKQIADQKNPPVIQPPLPWSA